MFEEKLIIDFTEYLSCFDDEGELKDSFEKNAQYCKDAINEAINRFIAGSENISHHGVNLAGKNFRACVEVEVSNDGVYISLNITRDNCSGILATYNFEPNPKLVLAKTYNMVSIE